MALNINIISGSYPPMRDGVGDYTRVYFHELAKQNGLVNTKLITTNLTEHLDIGPQYVYAVEKWNFVNMPRVISIIKKNQPDIINIQYPTHGYRRHIGATVLPWLLKWHFPRVPLIATLHEFTSLTIKGRYRLIFSLLKCDRIIIVNKSYAQDICNICPTMASRLVYVPIGSNIKPHLIEEEDISKQKKRWQLEQCAPILIYFGVLGPTKGIESLIRAYKIFFDRHSASRLLLVGHYNEQYLMDKIYPLIKSNGLDENIIITGRCNDTDISKFFAIADMCVLPFPDGVSTKRGSFMAALQHNQAIITTRPQQPFDELIDRVNVLFAEREAPGSVAERILELVHNPELSESIRKGVANIKRAFEWDCIVEKVMKVFKDSILKNA